MPTMGPNSPQTLQATSPNQFNHFAPLSPDAVNTTLDVDPEMTAILGLAPKPQARDVNEPPPRLPTGPLIVYSRADILRLSQRAVVPPGMGPLESWYGAPQKSQPVDDPAIASIAPAGRRGGGAGFGEGFGFGGGIGGRVLGRGSGTRNIGLRRQPGEQQQQQHHQQQQVDPAIAEQSRGNNFGGPMGKFAVRSTGERGPMRLGGDRDEQQPRGGDRDRRRRDDDWRRGERQAAPHQRNGDRRGPNSYNNRYEEDNAEPAWMNDDDELSAPLEDPAIASATSADPSDPLVKFVPGEDMIAAHKRAMKAREAGADGAQSWRSPGDKPLVSFFGGAAPQQPAAPVKPREVNLQSYFKHKAVDDEPEKEKEEAEETNAFQSRFQRFFGNTGGPSSGQSGAPAAPSLTSPVAVQERSYERQPERQYERQPEPQYERQPERYEHQQHHQQSPSHARSPIDQPSPVPGGRVDDHMSKLMGLLSTKGPSPAPREQNQQYQGMPPPGISPYQQSPSVETSTGDYMTSRSRQDHSPDHHMMPQHFSPPPGVDPRGYPYGPGPGGPPPGYPRSPMGELPPRQFYDQRSPVDRPPPDLLQLLQGGGRPPMPPMGMLPPHPMYGPGPGGPGPGPSPDDLLRNLQTGASPSPGAPPGYLPMRPNGPNGHPGFPPPPPPMQGFLPPPPGYWGPGGPAGPGGIGGPGVRLPPPSRMYAGPPPPGGPGGPGGPGQQDMLAALLGTRS